MTSQLSTPQAFKPVTVAGNGLLHRRSFLQGGAAFAATLTGYTITKSATAQPLADDPWSLAPGVTTPPYEQRSRFESKVTRTLTNPKGEPRVQNARTPLQLSQGTITPNGLHFVVAQSGAPDIDPAKHLLVIHGMVKQPLMFTLDALARYPTVSAVMRIPVLASGLFLFAGITPAALAQDFPSKPLRIVVPTAPGGSSDILGRLIGAKLHERLGQPAVVENRAGAGQMIGADVVAKAPADGHTMLLPTVTYTTSAATQSRLPFDAVNDLTGITMIGEGVFLLAVHPSLPVKSVKELLALARAKPGSLIYASSGTGGITHLITEVFAANTKIKLVHVPYKGVAPAVIDVVGGHVPMIIVSVPSVLPQVKAGRLRALASTGAQRSPFVPELPTVAEAGVPGYEARQWWGMLAPGKTPRAVIGKLNGEIHNILASADVKARLADEGAEPILRMTPEAFNDIVKNDIAKWRKIVNELGIKVD